MAQMVHRDRRDFKETQGPQDHRVSRELPEQTVPLVLMVKMVQTEH